MRRIVLAIWVLALAPAGVSAAEIIYLYQPYYGSPKSADQVLIDRLVSQDYDTLAVPCADLTSAQADTAELLIVSDTCTTGPDPALLRASPAAVLCSRVWLFDDLGLILPGIGSTDGDPTDDETGELRRMGSAPGRDSLSMVDPGGMFSAGLSGTVTVYDSPGEINWAYPVDSAEVIASITLWDDDGSSVDRAATFVVPSGGVLGDETIAPNRRAGFFLPEEMSQHLTADGLALFDVAVHHSYHPEPGMLGVLLLGGGVLLRRRGQSRAA